MITNTEHEADVLFDTLNARLVSSEDMPSADRDILRTLIIRAWQERKTHRDASATRG